MVERLTVVDHHMHARLWEDRCLARREDLRNEFGAVLLKHVRCGVALDGHNVVACARVIVRW